MHGARRLEERLPHRKDLFRLVVDRKTHLPFHDVAEHSTRMTMARACRSATGSHVQLDEHHVPSFEWTRQRVSRQFGGTSRRCRLRAGCLCVESNGQQRCDCQSKECPSILSVHDLSFIEV
jgi:hypothetical protein